MDRARILLAEDDQAMREFVHRALEMDGHEVTTVHDGGEAMERLKSPLHDYDLLVTDICIPVLDGVEIARELARQDPALPIILITGHVSQRDRAVELKGAVKGIVQKPFTLEQIRAQVRGALGPG